jgi:hypothetical protein
MPLTTPVDLGASGDFAVLSTTFLAGTDSTTVSGGNIGCIGAITGFKTGYITSGVEASAEATTLAIADLTVAIEDVKSRTGGTILPSEIGGLTLKPGLYRTTGATTMATSITLDGVGNYVFQIPATLGVSAGADVILINGAESDSIFWQVTGAYTSEAGTMWNGSVLGGGSVSTACTVGEETAGTCGVNGRMLTKLGAMILTNTTLAFSYSAATLETFAAAERALILSSLKKLSPFHLKLPTGETVVITPEFGESATTIVRSIVDTYALSSNNTNMIWAMFYGDSEIENNTLNAYTISDPNFKLRPKSNDRGNWGKIASDTYTRIITLKTIESSYTIPVDIRFSIGFYQLELLKYLDSSYDYQAWIDNSESFLSSSALINTIEAGSIIRVIMLEKISYLRAALD